jgi:short-subunit dehydrogenase
MQFQGKVALITGAASGIGRGLAQCLAERACHVALADINAAGLAETAALLASSGVQCSQHVLDVANRAAVALLPEQVLQQHGQLDALFNNAGVALGGSFEQVSEADFDWLMEINFHGLVRLTRACLPHLRRREQACIVNISSLFGILAPPGQTAYCASKFAVRGFSMALRQELQGSGVSVTVAHPGGVATQIAQNARLSAQLGAPERKQHHDLAQRFLRMDPRQAAQSIVRAAERGKARVLVGADAQLGAALERLLPTAHGPLLGRALSEKM